MSAKDQSKDAVKQPSANELKKLIEKQKEIIVKECKKLATFKVSSAVHINEATKELLRLEGSAK